MARDYDLKRPVIATSYQITYNIFFKHGIPDELVSDNCAQYASKEFKDFAKEYAFLHSTSCLIYHRSNVQA